MSIEIRQMLIKSQVVQRAADGADANDVHAEEPQPQFGRDWRAECRRMIGEVLDERKER
ncbi:DUF5908 family protein [Massilia psychrophila]|uniref:DUF5908 family protein n=1 Tax=Massilia psychrophila TaxID=1603353 RepID=UPI0019C6132D|nr:DUF5908 family protein [Massilia psychrophila]GGE72530.1 hypothetical protein GCM10008020_16510 [Massilia psychrophila]